MSVRFVILLLAVLAAGCSRSGSEYDEPPKVPAKEARAQAAIDNAVAVQGEQTVALSGAPVSEPTKTNRSATNALPTAFQGYWATSPNDCDLRIADARGRLAIDGDTLRFYESHAVVDRTISSAPNVVVADFIFRGEGGTVTRRTSLSLVAGGTRLVRTDQGAAQTITYQRC